MAEKALTVGVLVMAMAFLVLSDFAADQKECGSQLATLATCIPYVQGTAKFPAKDCCDGLLKLHLKDPKCLCVLIKDSSNPQLGISINKTLALQLPDDCKVAANVSRCPVLLHIPPNSPDAQVFKNTSSPSVANVSAAPQTNPYTHPAVKSLSCGVRPSMHWTVMVLIWGLGYVLLSADAPFKRRKSLCTKINGKLFCGAGN